MPPAYTDPSYVPPPSDGSGVTFSMLEVADEAGRLSLPQNSALGRAIKQADDATIWALVPGGSSAAPDDWLQLSAPVAEPGTEDALTLANLGLVATQAKVELGVANCTVLTNVLLPTNEGLRKTIHYSITELHTPLASLPGVRFMLAYTPYPPATTEHTEVAYSYDGAKWFAPSDMRRPIISFVAAPNNEGWTTTGDCDAMQLPDGTLAVYYVWTTTAGANKGQALYLVTSADGIVWGDPVQCFKGPEASGAGLLSPSAVLIGAYIHLYFRKLSTVNARDELYHCTAAWTAPTVFTEPVLCTIPNVVGGTRVGFHHLDANLEGDQIRFFFQMLGDSSWPNGHALTYQYLATFVASVDTPTVLTGNAALPVVPRWPLEYGEHFYRSSFLPALEGPDGDTPRWDGWIATWFERDMLTISGNPDNVTIAPHIRVTGGTSGASGSLMQYAGGKIYLHRDRFSGDTGFVANEQLLFGYVGVNEVTGSIGGTPITVTAVDIDADRSGLHVARNMRLDGADVFQFLPAPTPEPDLRNLLVGRRDQRNISISDGGETGTIGDRLDFEYKTPSGGLASGASHRIQNYGDRKFVETANKSMGLVEISGSVGNTPVYGKWQQVTNSASAIAQVGTTTKAIGGLTPILRFETVAITDLATVIVPGMTAAACDAGGVPTGATATVLTVTVGATYTDVRVKDFAGTGTLVFSAGNKVKFNGVIPQSGGSDTTLHSAPYCPEAAKISLVYCQFTEASDGSNRRGGYFSVYNSHTSAFNGSVSFKGSY